MPPWDRIFQLGVQYAAGRSLRNIRHEDLSLRLAHSGKPEDFERLVAVQFAWIWEDTLWPALYWLAAFVGYFTYTHDPPSRPFLKVSLQVHAEAARAPRVARLAFPPDDAGRSRMRPTRSASQAITCAVGYGTAFWSSTDSLAA